MDVNKEITKEFFHKHIEENYIPSLVDLFGANEDEVREFFEKFVPLSPDYINGNYRKALTRIGINAKSRFKPVNYSNVNYEVVFIGKSVCKDYGLRKKIAVAERLFQVNKSEALAKGFTNEKGEPLYTSGAFAGQVIDKSQIFSRYLIGIIKEGKIKRPLIFHLKNDANTINVPLFQVLNINGYISKKLDDIWKFGGSNNKTKLNIISNKIIDIEKYLPLFKDIFIKDYESLKYIAQIESNEYEICIIKGDLFLKEKQIGFRVIIKPILEKDFTEEVNESFSIEENYMVGNIDYNPMIKDISLNSYVIGKPFIDERDIINFNIYGIWTPDEFRLK